MKLPLLAAKECTRRAAAERAGVDALPEAVSRGADRRERDPASAAGGRTAGSVSGTRRCALATGKGTEHVRVGLRTEIDDLIERYYGSGRSAMGTIVENLSDDATRGGEDDVEHLRDLASEAPVIRLVNLIMQRAVEQRASDIHIEPFENRLKVRYRIDGVLAEVESPPASSTAAVISRIKIMAKLNIAERRLPQDGRIMLRVQGKELDLRVSTVPTSYGESVVMRILDRESVVLDFKASSASPTTSCRKLPQGAEPAARHHAGDRPDRFRQDHHAVHGAQQDQHAGREDHHRRGSGRIPDRGHQPDPGQAADRPGLLARAALDRAPGSGHHHDRRNARSGNREDRDPVGADRTSGAVDPAHQQRRRRHDSPARHGRRGLSDVLDRQRHPRAASGAPPRPRVHASATRRCPKWSAEFKLRNTPATTRSTCKPVPSER
jgi:hypothetical protein